MKSIEVTWPEVIHEKDVWFRDALKKANFADSSIEHLEKMNYFGKERLMRILADAGYYVNPKLLK